jgi:urease accessory protein
MAEGENMVGQAHLHVAQVAGASAAIRWQAHSPLRLLIPRSRGESVWAYTSSFGGGMVAGDCTRLDVAVDPGARCFLGTQASTKIYRNPGGLPCSHELHARVADKALLILAPDPVQCFASSRYEQRQTISLAGSASLILVDWMSAGRTARGERWGFSRYASRNEIVRDGQRLLLDAVRLDAADGPLDSRYRAGRFNCLATVVLLGPLVSSFATELLQHCAASPISPNANILFAASPLEEGMILRLAGTSVEDVGQGIHERLGFVGKLLKDDPWERKW